MAMHDNLDMGQKPGFLTFILTVYACARQLKKAKIYEGNLPCFQQPAEVELAKETLLSKANSVSDSQPQNSSCEQFQKPAVK